MNKLLIVTDFNENHNENFVAHFDEFMKNKDIDYRIVIVDLKSKKNLVNYGKLYNIGFLSGTKVLKDIYNIDFKWDYVVFHRSDFIPLDDECDYSYDERPKCLVGSVDEVSFGIHPDFIPNSINLPSKFFFNGSLMFTKKDFENLGGFHNNFWGDGYEDLHMIWKMGQLNYPTTRVSEKPKSITGIDLSFNNYGKIETNSRPMKNVINNSFTITCWVRLNKEIVKEGYVVSRPGYHSGIKFLLQDDKLTLSTNIWTFKNEYIRVGDYPINIGEWVHVGLSYSKDTKTANMYINGVLNNSVQIKSSIKKYPLESPFYIGIGTDDTNTSQARCDISIGDLGFYDVFLNEISINKIFNNGHFNTEYTIECPTGYYDFSSGYKNMIWDESGNGNSLLLYNPTIPKKNIVKEGDELYLPIRSRGNYGYIGNEYDKLNKENYEGSNSQNNYKILTKLISNKITNDLLECRFRVLKTEQYFEKHSILTIQA
tara:strand:- start:233 stop:1684 length:1452 start_codon:yes stop_codon:yes gene_type:complete